jgi:uncharacterized protein (TIGR03435 family)
LDGTFDFELSLIRMERLVAPDGRVSLRGTPSDVPLPTLLERELGLQLVERPVAQDVLVVDRVSRPAPAR